MLPISVGFSYSVKNHYRLYIWQIMKNVPSPTLAALMNLFHYEIIDVTVAISFQFCKSIYLVFRITWRIPSPDYLKRKLLSFQIKMSGYVIVNLNSVEAILDDSVFTNVLNVKGSVICLIDYNNHIDILFPTNPDWWAFTFYVIYHMIIIRSIQACWM